MAKLIIYLDQNFVSNMAKAKFLGGGSLASELQEYAEIYDRLKSLVDDDKVICPESEFHNLETIEPDLAGPAQRGLTTLSYGLCFRSHFEIGRLQAYRAAREFLNLAPEGTPQWEDAFDDDPNEPVVNRTFQWGTGRAIPTIPWQIDSSPPRPNKYMSDRRAAGGKFIWADLPERIKQEKDRLVQYMYGDHIDQYSTGEAGLLWETWRSLDAPPEKLADFLKSDHLRNLPFIDIHCTLCAAMDCEKGRQPRESDALDTLIMAVVLPYCDVVATSSDMKGLFTQTGLAGRYPARLYSAKKQGLQDLANFLVALKYAVASK